MYNCSEYEYECYFFPYESLWFTFSITQNPPFEKGEAGGTEPFHWAIPKLSASERYFLSQLISSPSRDVSYICDFIECYKLHSSLFSFLVTIT